MGKTVDKLQASAGERIENVTNLPSEDSSGMPDAARMNLDALANMANIPSRFQHLVAGLEAWRSAELLQQREEKEKRDRDFSDMAADFAQARQREIDENRVKLSIGGEDVDIAQGDLRNIMEKRAKELREQRDQMERSGAKAGELERMDNLLDQYDTLNDELKNGKADDVTLEAIQELAKQDPLLETRIKERGAPESVISVSRVSSFASEALQEQTGSESLRTTFARQVTPPPADRAPESVPKPSRPETAIQSLDF